MGFRFIVLTYPTHARPHAHIHGDSDRSIGAAVVGVDK